LHVLLGDAGVGTGQEFRTLLAAIDKQLGVGAAGEIVRALSLIAGGIPRDVLRRLLGPPPAEGVNMAASALSDAGWQAAVRQLQTQELLLRQDDREDDRIEAHPLVCEYFAQHWRQNAPDSWREGHRRLAEDYLQAANARPVDVQEAAPLLKAIRHAALVGYANYVNSAVQLFHQRLDRGELYFANHLGAPGDVLSSLSAFFEPGGWSLVSNVADGLKAYLLNSTGTMLRALGRLEDAIAVYSQALTVRIAEEDWKNASKNASNLSELALVLGRIEEALAHATASVALARRSDDIGQVIYCLTTLADAQHQAGMTREAQSNFEEAERIHVERIARRGHRMPVLYRIPGIRYAEFLLTKGDFGQIAARVEYLTSAGPDISDEETAYGILVVADALRLSQPVDALRFTDEALTRLRRAASEIYLPRAHLVRARARSRLGDHDPALVDVDRALVIARRNNANLFVIDAQIERSRIELDRGNRDVARAGLEAAKGAIEKLGYLRRMSDIADVETRL
jgi:tetratricopeptide (TPR) repeat protein